MLVLLGKSASGKNLIRDQLVSKGFKPIISYTTRPMRENEKDGVDYHFVDNDYFETHKMFNQRNYEVANGEVWRYGFDELDMVDDGVIIIDAIGLWNLQQKSKFNTCSFYIKASDDIRSERAIKRGDDVKEIMRRIDADRRDFYLAETKVDFVMSNNTGNPYVLADLIKDIYDNFMGGFNEK